MLFSIAKVEEKKSEIYGKKRRLINWFFAHCKQTERAEQAENEKQCSEVFRLHIRALMIQTGANRQFSIEFLFVRTLTYNLHTRMK